MGAEGREGVTMATDHSQLSLARAKIQEQRGLPRASHQIKVTGRKDNIEALYHRKVTGTNNNIAALYHRKVTGTKNNAAALYHRKVTGTMDNPRGNVVFHNMGPLSPHHAKNYN